MRLDPLAEADLKELSEFVARQSDDPSNHVAYVHGPPESALAHLAELIPVAGSVVLREAGRIVGFMGLETDPKLGRAWLWGPYAEPPSWNAHADRLYDAVLANAPSGIFELELAFDTRNLRGREFAWRHRFKSWKCGSAAMMLDRRAMDPVPGIGLLEPSLEPAFIALHDKSFPETYYTGRQIVEMIDARNRVCTATKDGALLGYAYTRVEPEDGEVFLHFMAVDRAHHRRGLGRALLSAVYSWGFGFDTVARGALMVELSNVSAIRLYERFGFARERVLMGFRGSLKLETKWK